MPDAGRAWYLSNTCVDDERLPWQHQPSTQGHLPLHTRSWRDLKGGVLTPPLLIFIAPHGTVPELIGGAKKKLNHFIKSVNCHPFLIHGCCTSIKLAKENVAVVLISFSSYFHY